MLTCARLVCRFAIWPEVRAFIAALPSGAVVADVGCGNGKYFGVRSDVAVLGSDRSTGLVSVAMRAAQHQQERGGHVAADVLVADGFALPYRAGSVDAVLCIAVLHHVSSNARRLRFLRSVRDLLRPGGRAIVTVWATQQEYPSKTVDKWTAIDVSDSDERGAAPRSCPAPESKGDGAHPAGDNTSVPPTQPPSAAAGSEGAPEACDSGSADYFVPWHVPFHRAGQHLTRPPAAKPHGAAPSFNGAAQTDESVASARTEAAHGTAARAAVGEVNHEKRSVVFKRYYHLFQKGELESLVSQVEGVQLCSAKYDASNWVAVFERFGD